MTDLPKPRCDSVLKILPEERQAEIVQFARDHGVIKTALWLSHSGVATSKSAVARFLSWYRQRQSFLQLDTAAIVAVAELATERPDLTPERLDQAGHIFFTGLALQKQDHKSWHMAQQIACRAKRLTLDIRKYDDKSKSPATVCPTTR
jgi:hypothetical protein